VEYTSFLGRACANIVLLEIKVNGMNLCLWIQVHEISGLRE
jgi:hypothetical protein